jgi:NAD(P)-dependent dehydrogenase (short-subunit alcohol dehydrogenase family)
VVPVPDSRKDFSCRTNGGFTAMGMLDGKVAFITGGSPVAHAGRARAHAVTCAREGTDVIILDIAAQLGTVRYKMATQADLDEPVAQVEAFDLWVLKPISIRIP